VASVVVLTRVPGKKVATWRSWSAPPQKPRGPSLDTGRMRGIPSSASLGLTVRLLSSRNGGSTAQIYQLWRRKKTGATDLDCRAIIDLGLVLWEGCRESRRCSRDTYPESYIIKYTSIRRKQMERNRGVPQSPYRICKREHRCRANVAHTTQSRPVFKGKSP
jgi:hypothetical protein